MKKIAAVILALALLVPFCCSCEKKDTLKLYIPGAYLSDEVVKDFEKENNCRVIIELFDSNEMMYTKLQSGDKYDVLVPSDYMVERLIKNDYLQKIDASKITNFAGISENVPYGISKDYGVPYFWGSVGIVYNYKNVPTEVVEAQGYSLFRNTDYKGRFYFYDSERDSFMVALKALGYSMNTTDENEIQKAYEWLCAMNSEMSPTYVTDEVIDNMATGLMDFAYVYSGDAAYILESNEDMRFFMPSEGTNLWTDYMVIPKNAENVDLAHKFIDFMISHDAALANSEEVGYASPVASVLEELTKEGAIYSDNNAYLPRKSGEKDEIYVDDIVLQTKLSELWMKVLASN